jgi:hypothetical protein
MKTMNLRTYILLGNAFGKIWLEPELNIVYFNGFTKAEQKDILNIIVLNTKS